MYISLHICTSSLVNQDFFSVESVKYFANVMKKLFPSKAFANNTISHFGDSIEGKRVTAVNELNGSDCGDATEETDKSDYDYKVRL